MKLTILGSGTCVNQLPNVPNRFPPGFLINWNDEKLLLDCSEGIRFRIEQAGFDFTTINHIAISHSHPDHCAITQFIQAKYVSYWWQQQKNQDLHIYCPDFIKNNFPSLWNFHNPDIEKMWEPIKLIGMSKPGSQEKIGTATLKSFPVYHAHGKIDALAFRIETKDGIIAYSGDSGECAGVEEACENADMFICDSSSRILDQTNQTTYGHLSPRQAGKIAKKSKVKKLILVHYQGFDSDEEMVASAKESGFEGEVVVGKDFLTFSI